jgi:hypothetical protein
MTRYKKSTRDTYLKRLGGRGLVELVGDGCTATDAGLAALGDFEPLPTGAALLQHHLERLPRGERVVLEALAPKTHAVTRDLLSTETGYRKSSRDTYLKRLANRGLVVLDHAGVRLSPMLTDGGTW